MTSPICPGSRRNSGIAAWPVTMPSANASCREFNGISAVQHSERWCSAYRARRNFVDRMTLCAVRPHKDLASLRGGRLCQRRARVAQRQRQ